MSEREFFSDEPSNAELDEAFDGDVLSDDDLDGAEDSAPGEEDLPDDSESDDSEGEEEDPFDEDEADDDTEEDSDEDDEPPSPSTDPDGWFDSLDDDERAFVESAITQAAESSHLYNKAREMIQMAGMEIQKRDQAIRALDQMNRIQSLAQKDPEKFQAFKNHLEWSQRQRQQQQQSPEAIQLAQTRQGLQQFIATQIERERFSALRNHVRSGQPLHMDDGSQVAFAKLSQVEDDYLFSAPNEREFDRRVMALHQSRQQQTEAARAAKRQQRTAQGQDRGPVRSSGRASGRDNDYDNYDLDRMSDYLDDAQYGRAR